MSFLAKTGFKYVNINVTPYIFYIRKKCGKSDLNKCQGGQINNIYPLMEKNHYDLRSSQNAR